MNYDDLHRSIVLLSDVKCGDGGLRSALEDLGKIWTLGEPFNPWYSDARTLTYQTFLEGRGAEETFVGAGVFPKFMAHLYDRCPKGEQRILLDIKYPQLFTLGVDENHLTPNLLRELAEARMPFLHLIRRDCVAQAMSYIVANQPAPDNLPPDETPKPLWLNPRDVLAIARSRGHALEQVSRHLSRLKANVLTVVVEDLTSPARDDELRRVFRFLDHYADIPADYRPWIDPSDPLLRVVNRQEVLEYINREEPRLISRTLY